MPAEFQRDSTGHGRWVFTKAHVGAGGCPACEGYGMLWSTGPVHPSPAMFPNYPHPREARPGTKARLVESFCFDCMGTGKGPEAQAVAASIAEAEAAAGAGL